MMPLQHDEGGKRGGWDMSILHHTGMTWLKFAKDDKTRAYRYSSEQLSQALDSGTDIRL